MIGREKYARRWCTAYRLAVWWWCSRSGCPVMGQLGTNFVLAMGRCIPYGADGGCGACWISKMMISGHKKCPELVLYSMDWPQWVNECKVPDFDGIFGQLNFDIETWSIVVKTCEIVQEIWWKLKFWATSRVSEQMEKTSEKSAKMSKMERPKWGARL